MIINEHEALAIFLREHPAIIVKKDDGTQFSFNPFVKKYYCQKEKNKVRNGIYLARGLEEWWEYFARKLKPAEVVLPVDIEINIDDIEGVLPL